MSRFAFALLLLVGLAGIGFQAVHRAEGQSAPVDSAKVPKVVIHINFADADQQKGGLRNITNILKAADDAVVEVVCHGPGISLVVDGQTKYAEEVAKLLGQGVQFVACENTMHEKSIPREKLLPDVGTVPSGAVEVIRRQQRGFAYFKP